MSDSSDKTVSPPVSRLMPWLGQESPLSEEGHQERRRSLSA
jgi:hypothetical protein